jgi:hypothetical protein
MNALKRWWYNLILPAPGKVARNHVAAAFLLGRSRVDIWKESIAEARKMRTRGVNEEWLKSYLQECQLALSLLRTGTDRS